MIVGTRWLCIRKAWSSSSCRMVKAMSRARPAPAATHSMMTTLCAAGNKGAHGLQCSCIQAAQDCEASQPLVSRFLAAAAASRAHTPSAHGHVAPQIAAQCLWTRRSAQSARTLPARPPRPPPPWARLRAGTRAPLQRGPACRRPWPRRGPTCCCLLPRSCLHCSARQATSALTHGPSIRRRRWRRRRRAALDGAGGSGGSKLDPFIRLTACSCSTCLRKRCAGGDVPCKRRHEQRENEGGLAGRRTAAGACDRAQGACDVSPLPGPALRTAATLRCRPLSWRDLAENLDLPRGLGALMLNSTPQALSVLQASCSCTAEQDELHRPGPHPLQRCRRGPAPAAAGAAPAGDPGTCAAATGDSGAGGGG